MCRLNDGAIESPKEDLPAPHQRFPDPVLLAMQRVRPVRPAEKACERRGTHQSDMGFKPRSNPAHKGSQKPRGSKQPVAAAGDPGWIRQAKVGLWSRWDAWNDGRRLRPVSSEWGRSPAAHRIVARPQGGSEPRTGVAGPRIRVT